MNLSKYDQHVRKALVFLLLIFPVGASYAQEIPMPSAKEPRRLECASIKPISNKLYQQIQQWSQTNRTGPRASAYSSTRPSKYLDFGMDAGIAGKMSIQPSLTGTSLMSVLSPKYGSFKKTAADTYLFKFKPGGQNLKVTVDSKDKVMDLNTLYNNYPQEKAALRLFRDALRESKATGKVFKPNPYYQDELEALMTLSSQKPVQTGSLRAPDDNSPFDGVIFVSDQHGSDKRINIVSNQIPHLDWVGLEMLTENMNPILKAYHEAKKGTEIYRKNRKRLVEYFTKHWTKFGKDRVGEQNPYFQLVKTAKNKGIRVYALDVSFDYYNLRPMSHPMVMGVRNRVWVRNLPTSGKGMVLGGAAHFSGTASVQSIFSNRNLNYAFELVQLGKDSCNTEAGINKEVQKKRLAPPAAEQPASSPARKEPLVSKPAR